MQLTPQEFMELAGKLKKAITETLNKKVLNQSQREINKDVDFVVENTIVQLEATINER